MGGINWGGDGDMASSSACGGGGGGDILSSPSSFQLHGWCCCHCHQLAVVVVVVIAIVVPAAQVVPLSSLSSTCGGGGGGGGDMPSSLLFRLHGWCHCHYYCHFSSTGGPVVVVVSLPGACWHWYILSLGGTGGVTQGMLLLLFWLHRWCHHHHHLTVVVVTQCCCHFSPMGGAVVIIIISWWWWHDPGHIVVDLLWQWLLWTLHLCLYTYAYSFLTQSFSSFKLLQWSALGLNTASLFHAVHDSFTLTHWLNLFPIYKHSLLISALLPSYGCAHPYLWLEVTHTSTGPIAISSLISMFCWTSSNSPSYLWSEI